MVADAARTERFIRSALTQTHLTSRILEVAKADV